MGSYLHFLSLMTYVTLLSTQGQGQGHEQGQLIIDRHNYGFTLTKTGSLGLTTARARMLFHFAIRAAYNIRMSDYIMYSISSEQNRTEQQQHNKHRTVFGRGHQQKTVYRLADNILFLSNISKIHVNCASHNFTDVIPVQKPQMILSIQCGCRFIFDTILYYSFTSNCAENQNVSDSLQISYGVNLALLTEFFKDTTELNLIKPDHLFDEEISVNLPKLSIASKDYAAKLAKGQKLTYDMAILINQTMADSQMYDDLSHYLYNHLVQNMFENDSNFNIFNIFHWLLIIAMTAAGVALVWLFILHNRYRSILFMMTTKSASAASLDPTIPLSLQFTISSTQPPPSVQDTFLRFRTLMQEFLPIEILVLMALIVIVLFLILKPLIRYFKENQRNKTKIILRLATDKHAFEQIVGFLRFSSENYRFDIRPSDISLFHYSIFAHLTWGGGVTVTDVLLDEVLNLNTTTRIAPWHIRKVRNILSGQNGYSAVLIITNSNGNIDLITLKRRILTTRHTIDAGNRLSSSNLAGGSAPTISVYNEKLPLYPTL